MAIGAYLRYTRLMKKTKDTWDLTPLFAHDNDPAIERERTVVKKVTTAFVKKWQKRTDYLTDPKVLKKALDEYEAWAAKYGPGSKEHYYFELRQTQDQNNPLLRAKVNRSEDFSNELSNQIQFFAHRLALVDKATQKRFLTSPLLASYRHFLERLFAEAKYLLSEPEEKLMLLKSRTAHSNWVQMTESFITKEERVITVGKKKIRKTFPELSQLMNHSDKKIRDQAARGFTDIMTKHEAVAEQEINSVLLNKKVDDELRKTPRPDTLRLEADDIEPVVVDALRKAVTTHYDIAQDYYKLKARLLGVKKIAYHERALPIGNTNYELPYDQALAFVGTTLTQLDPEFGAIFNRFVQNGQFDVYSRVGKSGGGFCAGSLLSTPTYILLNYSGRLDYCLTIAHETGHGINNELMRAKQHALYFDTPLSTAEVASTFMEDFILEKMMATAHTDHDRLAIIMAKLNDDVSTIFRQIACYEFEWKLHQTFRQDGYIAQEKIGQLFQTEMKRYMGPAVSYDAGTEKWWIYWTHIRKFFYVYSYASGLLISKALQARVRKNPAFIKQVKEFLAAGMSESPRQIFRHLGLDISKPAFWNEGIDEIRTLLNEAKRLAKKIGR